MPKLCIYAAGSNSHGQLGLGCDDDAHSFTRCVIPLEQELVAVVHEEELDFKIAAGANHTLLLLREGNGTDRPARLFVAGSSKRGQLGRRSDQPAHTFEPVAPAELLAASRIDALAFPEQAESLRVADIAAGWESSFILLRSAASEQIPSFRTVSTLLAMGSNDYGQLAVEGSAVYANIVPLDGITRIYSGPRHTVAQLGKKDKESMAGWGSSRKGQLSSSSNDQPPPTTWTPAPFRFNPSSACPFEVVDVALGQAHTCMLFRKAGDHGGPFRLTWCGARSHGQIGDSAEVAPALASIPPGLLLKRVYATWNSTFILGESEAGETRLYSLGNNRNGQLGRCTANKASGTAGEVLFDGSRRRILQLAAGSEHILALLEGLQLGSKKEIWGWGWNEHGNLGLQGDGQLEDVRLPKKLQVPVADDYLGIAAGNGTSWIFAMNAD